MRKVKVEIVRFFKYKCRKCGSVFTWPFPIGTSILELEMNINNSDEQLDFIKERLGHPFQKGSPYRYVRPQKYNFHNCKDGSFGFADLIGLTKGIPEKEYFKKLEAKEASFNKLQGGKRE